MTEWLLLSANEQGSNVVIKRVYCDTKEQAAAKVKFLFPDLWFAVKVVKGVTFKNFDDFEKNRKYYEDIQDCRYCPYANSKHQCKLYDNADCPTYARPVWCPNDYLRLVM